MQTDDATVRVQVLDGTWEVFGADRGRGIVPENVACSANEWGSDTASFDLRRDPAVMWPDLQAFSPVEVEVGGELVWSGRLRETPARDGDDPVINVQCEGWPYHLDDDSFAAFYVHSRVGDWRDMRTFPTAVLGAGQAFAGGQVANDNGTITLAFPNGVQITNGSHVGVVLDLGPGNTAAGASVDYETSNNHANAFLFCRGHTAPDSTGWAANDIVSTPVSTLGASGSVRGAFPTPRRYLHVFLRWNTTGGALAIEIFVKIKAVRVFAKDAYRAADASVLKASTVVTDARARAAPLLSADASKVTATTFDLPDLSFPLDPRTPREVIAGVNALHNYRTQVDVERRLVFGPRPAAPVFEVGAWGASRFEDSAINSGQDVYNRALVTGSGPDGAPLIVGRAATGPLRAVRSPAFPAATEFGVGTGTSDSAEISAVTGMFYAGVTYRAYYSASASGGRPYSSQTIELGTFSDNRVVNTADSPNWVDWTPAVDAPANTVRLIYRVKATGFVEASLTTPTQLGNVDTNGSTLADRRGFRRTKILPVSAVLTAAVAQQIGDTYLAAHRTQPLRGQVTVTPGGVRRVLSGEDVHPAHLLTQTQQLLRLSHRVDPDTGALGRDGTIATVTYAHATRTAQLAIDSDRRNFESLLARYAALSPA